MLKDGDGGFIRRSRPFFMVGVLLCCMIGLGVRRHQDGENILLTRQRIYGNILLDF